MADDHRMFIAGEWVGSERGSTFEATSPSTGEVIGTLPRARVATFAGRWTLRGTRSRRGRG